MIEIPEPKYKQRQRVYVQSDIRVKEYKILKVKSWDVTRGDDGWPEKDKEHMTGEWVYLVEEGCAFSPDKHSKYESSLYETEKEVIDRIKAEVAKL